MVLRYSRELLAKSCLTGVNPKWCSVAPESLAKSRSRGSKRNRAPEGLSEIALQGVSKMVLQRVEAKSCSRGSKRNRVLRELKRNRAPERLLKRNRAPERLSKRNRAPEGDQDHALEKG